MRHVATGRLRSFVLAATSIGFAVMLAMAGSPAAAAVTGLTISTTYPSVQVDPGGEVDLPLSVQTPNPEKVDLSVKDVPTDFKATFRGGGFIVSSVYTVGNEASPAPSDLKLRIEVPATAASQDYTMTVHAQGQSGAADLAITLKVATSEGEGVTVSTPVPAKAATIGDNVSFSVTVKNDTATDLNFAASIPDPPSGWTITAKPANDADPNNFPVAAGDSTAVTVSVDAPQSIQAGDYGFHVVVNSGDKYTQDLQLGVRFTGSEELSLAATILNTQATAGNPTDYAMTLQNTGSANLQNVSLTSDAPSNWKVEFAPPNMATVAPGETVAVTAKITPASDAVAGDYVVTLTADSGQATDKIDVRVRVETPSIWWIVGVGLIALVVIGLLLVFRQYGRR